MVLLEINNRTIDISLLLPLVQFEIGRIEKKKYQNGRIIID